MLHCHPEGYCCSFPGNSHRFITNSTWMQLTQDVWMTFGTFDVFRFHFLCVRRRFLCDAILKNLYFSKDVHPHKETALMKLERDIIWYHILITVNYFGIRHTTLKLLPNGYLWVNFCEALFSFFSSSVFCFGSPSSFWRAPFKFPKLRNFGRKPWWEKKPPAVMKTVWLKACPPLNPAHHWGSLWTSNLSILSFDG